MLERIPTAFILNTQPARLAVLPETGTAVSYQLKTTANSNAVSEFLDRITDAGRRQDAYEILALMQRVTGKPPRMWGPSIVGFDEYHYRYESGHEGDMCMIGFSPRAKALTLYALPDMPEREALLARLGKHKTGKGCLYINKLADIDRGVLEDLLRAAYAWMQARHG